MYSAALACKDEFDEVSVSSTEVLETNVIAIRAELKEFKADHREHRAELRAALARVDNDIKTAALRLETEIRAMAAKAERDLKQFADRVDAQLAEQRAEQKYLREKVDDSSTRLDTRIDDNFNKLDARIDRNFITLNTKIDDNFVKLDAKIDSNFVTLNTKIDDNFNKLDAKIEKLDAKFDVKFDALAKIVLKIDSRLSAMQWVGGGLVAFATVAFTAGKALDWF